jgi:hypothetical protein
MKVCVRLAYFVIAFMQVLCYYSKMKIELYNMLKSSAQADLDKAKLTLDLLSNHAVGIGDHSTDDYYKNAEQALCMYIDAIDRLEGLDKYFGSEDCQDK